MAHGAVISLKWLCWDGCYGGGTHTCPLHDDRSFHNGEVLSQLWKNIWFSFGRPSSYYRRVGSIAGIISYILRRLCASVLKMLSVVVLQIKSKRHRNNSKTQKAHRKVRKFYRTLHETKSLSVSFIYCFHSATD